MLRERILSGLSVGLSRRNSRVMFEALELRDLLDAQLAMDEAAAKAAAALEEVRKPAHTVAERRPRLPGTYEGGGRLPGTYEGGGRLPGTYEGGGRHLSVDTTAAVLNRNADEEPRSPLRGKAASEANAPPPIFREKTQDALERLGSALDVFVEPVSTEVPAGLPKPRPFVEVLKERAEQMERFIRQVDVARRDAILATVSSAIGVTDIETEQCREQEQEKAQEQEQEQEIEMERYVDMAYQRDDEEPKRWAFCTLGEGTSAEGTPSPAPLASGTFYQASKFRLHGRASLPFPPCLAVSRNHFNLDWVGERRLKNAVMVMEWVPSVAQLQRVSPSAPVLGDEQRARLDKALAMLDLRGDGRFERADISQVLRAAEHEELDEAAIDEMLSSVVPAWSQRERNSLSTHEMRELLVTGALRRGDTGRHFVLLSLAEAETIRCILHMRQGKELIAGTDVALALRCIPANDVAFDATANLPAATAYHRRVAQQSFRFLDSAMHYRPSELNVLLRSLPAPPAARRLFFSMVVACRRRLAKRWEQTPLAKLFTLEDEWAMLQLEALRVRMREAIKARGLLLHDAFLLFDVDDDGALSLVEVLGALRWLGVPHISLADVVAFVRSLSRSAPSGVAHLSYGAFIELLSTPDEALDVVADAVSTPPPATSAGETEAIATVATDATLIEELGAMWAEGVRAERALDERLEKEMAAQAERARLLAEQQLLDSDFDWMRAARESGARNPRTTRTSCFYDFTRGVAGSQRGAPLWMEGRGRWFHVRQGSARVPCLKGCGNAFLVLRVPYRKSGGGTHCNAWTLTMQVKFAHASARQLLSTGGWDQYTQMQEGDEAAQLKLSEAGALGTLGTVTSDEGSEDVAAVENNKWHTLSVAVDAVSGLVRTYVDGMEGVAVRSSKICKDSQFALKGRLALFYGGRAGGSEYYLRAATVHNHVLDAGQIAKEHAALGALLIEDAIATVPSCLRPAMAAEHAGERPYEDLRALKARVRELRASGTARATELWRALLLEAPSAGGAAVDALLAKLDPHDLAVGVRHAFEAKASAPIEEADAPYGETLLHAAAHVGRARLVEQLLAAGARPSREGLVSGCTPLHAAAAGGHTAVCQLLLDAGARVGTLSLATKRSALHLACLNGRDATAKLLVSAGGADPYLSVHGGESAMALLRRLATAESLGLLAALDAICGSSGAADAQAVPAAEDAADGDADALEGECNSDSDDEGGGAGSDEQHDEYCEDEDEEGEE